MNNRAHLVILFLTVVILVMAQALNLGAHRLGDRSRDMLQDALRVEAAHDHLDSTRIYLDSLDLFVVYVVDL